MKNDLARSRGVSAMLLVALASGSAACGDDATATDAGRDGGFTLDAPPAVDAGRDAGPGFDAGPLEYPTCDPRAGAAACPEGERCALVFTATESEFVCRFDGSLYEGDACEFGTNLTFTVFVDQCLDGTVCSPFGPGAGIRCERVCVVDRDCATGERCLLVNGPAPPLPHVGICRTPDPCDPLSGSGCAAEQRCHLVATPPTTELGATTICDQEGVREEGESCRGLGPVGCVTGHECVPTMHPDRTLDPDSVPHCTRTCDPAAPAICGTGETCVALSPTAGLCTRSDPAPIGTERPANIFVPSAHDGTTPLPLIISLHGYGGDGDSMDVGYRVRHEGERVGAYVLLPDGNVDESGRKFWNATPACCDLDGTGVDDSTYLAGLVDATAAVYPVDRDRVFLIGRSNGGFMAYRLACDHADLFAAIASEAGSTFLDEASCMATAPVSVLQMHGTADTNVPYGGSPGMHPGAVETVERWATRAGCDLAMAVDGAPYERDLSVDGPETTMRTWSAGCAPGLEMALETMEGSTHFPELAPDASPRIFDWLLAHGR